MYLSIPVHCTVLFSIHQIQVRYLIQVPIHQASSDPCSGRPSGVGDGGGGRELGTKLFPSRKIAQVLEEVDQRALSLEKLI
jgi:hypothetical protein